MTEYHVSRGKLYNGNPNKPYTFGGIKEVKAIIGDNAEKIKITYYPNSTGIVCRIVNNSCYEALEDGVKVTF
ncbi:MAG: hypothetical protein QXM68_03330 [Candidatus Aenigmatarchaeota archaeon]|nr:hypothetical protein [Candidatus Aenigmarchaeota archaeon]